MIEPSYSGYESSRRGFTHVQKARKAKSYSRALDLEDVEAGGFMMEPWARANIGPDGAEAFKQALLSDYHTWLVPAALLMTVSFGLLFALSKDEINATPDGFAYEHEIRVLAAHVYMLSLIMSGILALRCINSFSQMGLALCHTPATLVPHLRNIIWDVNEMALGKEVQPDWAAALSSPELWDQCVSDMRLDKSWPYRLAKALHMPDKYGAFFGAVYTLDVGVILGAYLKFGVTYAAMMALPLFVASKEMRFRCKSDFYNPWRLMVDTMRSDDLLPPHAKAMGEQSEEQSAWHNTEC